MPVEISFPESPLPLRVAAHGVAADRHMAYYIILLIGGEHHVVQADQALGMPLYFRGSLLGAASEPQEHDGPYRAFAGGKAAQYGHDAEQVGPPPCLDITRREQGKRDGEIENRADDLIFFLGVQVISGSLHAVRGEESSQFHGSHSPFFFICSMARRRMPWGASFVSVRNARIGRLHTDTGRLR